MNYKHSPKNEILMIFQKKISVFFENLTFKIMVYIYLKEIRNNSPAKDGNRCHEQYGKKLLTLDNYAPSNFYFYVKKKFRENCTFMLKPKNFINCWRME